MFRKIISITFLVFWVALLAACADPRKAVPTALVTVSKTDAPATEEVSEAPATATATELPAPTLQPTPTEVVNNCLSCHTDKERLVTLAKPEEAHDSESSGVG